MDARALAAGSEESSSNVYVNSFNHTVQLFAEQRSISIEEAIDIALDELQQLDDANKVAEIKSGMV